MKLIAGLGNPGNAYKQTRHNIGFMALDRLAAETGGILGHENLEALIGRGIWAGQELMLAKPLTFMNRSGVAIRAIVDTYALQSTDVIILHDDMDIPFGAIRIKTKGGAGGHRGIASIRRHLQTDAFVRLRIGIGRPSEAVAEADYVLERFSESELQKIAAINASVTDCLKIMLTQGIPTAMNLFHTRQDDREKNRHNPVKELYDACLRDIRH